MSHLDKSGGISGHLLLVHASSFEMISDESCKELNAL